MDNKKAEQMQIPNPKGGNFDLKQGYPSSGYAKITYISKKQNKITKNVKKQKKSLL